jgi:hypothetical protein
MAEDTGSGESRDRPSAKRSAGVAALVAAGLAAGALAAGGLASGATAVFTITVKVGGASNKTSISNTATATSPNFDPNLANNAAIATTQITGNKK